MRLQQNGVNRVVLGRQVFGLIQLWKQLLLLIKEDIMKTNAQRTYIVRYIADNGLYETVKFTNIAGFFAFVRILYKAKISYKYKILEGDYVISQN